MYYRHELKFEVSEIELKKLEYRLKPLLKKDMHQDGDYYLIRSLYFDDIVDSCLNENLAGVDNRSKYRIRTYNGSSSIINLEKKSKLHGMTHKDSTDISIEQCNIYMNKNIPKLADCESELEKELFAMASSKRMLPKCIVEYERSAYVLPQGNVRITFDKNIRGSNDISQFFNQRIDAIPVQEGDIHVLEVKYDEFLPEYLLAVLDLGNLRRQSFSKYASVRMVCG